MWSRVVMSQVKHNSYFITGMVIGLWISLAAIPMDEDLVGCERVAELNAPTLPDEYEPQREARPLGPAGQPARALQRPRYYTTELGMRGSVLTGVLSAEERLETQVAAINDTAARLQPALKFFITASGTASRPPRPNVVGFTDTREMLKPFHALKYLADNYLEEYDFFFLVTDESYINTRSLTELVAGLSVSRDVYMGEPDGDSQYCSLEAGVLLSNSVLRAVHAELDWCVRNSYSPRHHENVGRCVLHAAHAPCARRLQGRQYRAARLDASDALRPQHADAVTVRGAPPAAMYRLHAYVSRERARRARLHVRSLRGALRRTAARHPPGYRNASWPAGLRNDPGLAPPPPDSRFDHLRWTAFNATHALMPDELHAAAPLRGAWAAAVEGVWRELSAWAERAGLGGVSLVEGAWAWEAPAALRFRAVVRAAGGALRLVAGARALGAARLAPVRYVTESARVGVLLPAPRDALPAAVACLRRLAAMCGRTQPDCNIAVYVAELLPADGVESAELRVAAEALNGRTVRVESDAGPTTEPDAWAAAQRLALDRLLPLLPTDQPLLLIAPKFEFDRDFLNRVRMNTIRGEQWFLPVPFTRFATSSVSVGGARAPHAGRFVLEEAVAVALYRGDYEAARGAGGAGGEAGGVAAVLARGGLRCVRAPEPGAARSAGEAPCGAGAGAGGEWLTCAMRARRRTPPLGTRAALAQLVLEAKAA